MTSNINVMKRCRPQTLELQNKIVNQRMKKMKEREIEWVRST